MCLKCIKNPHNIIKILCSDPSAGGGTGLLMSPATLQRVRAKKRLTVVWSVSPRHCDTLDLCVSKDVIPLKRLVTPAQGQPMSST